MLEKNRFAFAALVLCAILEIAATCGTTPNCRGSRRYYNVRCRHNMYGKRNVNYEEGNDVSDIENTSCGETLCSSVKNYPYIQISEGVRRVHIIMSSIDQDPFFRSEEERIDSDVLSFFHSNPSSRFNKRIFNSEKCEVLENLTHPQEGVSSDDGKVYFIVNVAKMRQRIQGAECILGNTCNNSDDGPISTCQQTYRMEKLLTLPLGIYDVDVSDFKMRKFKVPDGCGCSILD